MKILILILLLPVLSYSQVTFSEVVEVEKTKAQLQSSARQWLVNSYSGDVNELDGDGIIIGKGVIVLKPVKVTMGKLFYKVQHKVKIQVKDGKYKVTVYDLVFNNSIKIIGYNPYSLNYSFPAESLISDAAINKSRKKKVSQAIRDYTDIECNALMSSLKKAMTADDDW